MRPTEEQILAIMKLGFETLSRGDPLSLHDAFARSGDTSRLAGIRQSKLASLLKSHPAILQQWVLYSEAKSNGGYRVDPQSFEVVSLESDGIATRYGSIHDAVAEFILRELGYWSAVGMSSAPKALPTVDELVAGFDQKRDSDVGHACNRYFNPHGVEALIPLLLEAYGRIASWRGRNVILFNLIRFARTRPAVLQLAIEGLNDPAYMVRMQSCIMLAYSQRDDMIPHLERVLSNKDKKTRDYAAEALRHIRDKTVFYEIN